MMKLNITLTDERLERPGDQYSRKITTEIIKVEDLESTGPVVASLLRGVANSIDNSQVRTGQIIGSGGITFNG